MSSLTYLDNGVYIFNLKITFYYVFIYCNLFQLSSRETLISCPRFHIQLLHFSVYPLGSQLCLKSCMLVACPVHPSASSNILGPSLPLGLLASGSAEDVALEERGRLSLILMIIHSELKPSILSSAAAVSL